MTYQHLRQLPISRGKAALLVIDMQKEYAAPGIGFHKTVDPNNMSERQRYFFDRMRDVTIPAVRRLLQAFRAKKGEVVFTHVEGLTKDCRDFCLDYKIGGFTVPKGSIGAEILDEVKPLEDEINIAKTSTGAFNSTNIEYVLRNLGVTQLVMVGIMTHQCVEAAVRDAADRGFLVTMVGDACAAKRQESHESSLLNMRPFARICDHEQILKEVDAWPEDGAEGNGPQ